MNKEQETLAKIILRLIKGSNLKPFITHGPADGDHYESEDETYQFYEYIIKHETNIFYEVLTIYDKSYNILSQQLI